MIRETAPELYRFELYGNVWIIPKLVNVKINIPIHGGCYLTLDGKLGQVDWIEDWRQQAIDEASECLDKNFIRK